jgi:hypothetical protein
MKRQESLLFFAVMESPESDWSTKGKRTPSNRPIGVICGISGRFNGMAAAEESARAARFLRQAEVLFSFGRSG